MNIGAFDKPRLARPLIRCHWLIIERHPEVIDTLVSSRIIIRIAENILESRANPAFLVQLVGREGCDPFLSVAAVALIFVLAPRIEDNLWPMIVVLHV